MLKVLNKFLSKIKKKNFHGENNMWENKLSRTKYSMYDFVLLKSTEGLQSIPDLPAFDSTWARVQQYNIATAQHIVYRHSPGPTDSPH
jgi:hypothetical protein